MNTWRIIIITGNILILALAGHPKWRQGTDGDYDSVWETTTPNVSSSLETLRVDEGDSITFPCEVDSEGDHDLVWTKDGETVWIMQFYRAGYYIQRMTNDSRINPDHTSLTIKTAKLEDAGEYSCQLHQLKKYTTYELEVIAPPKIQPSPSSLIIIRKGKPIKISCLVTGYPFPEIRWFKEGTPFTVGVHKETFTIRKAKPRHSGLYTCKAENEFGAKAEANITLEVQYPPKLTMSQASVFTGIGQAAYLFCNVNSLPPARVVWYKDAVLTNDDRSERRIVEVGVHRLQIHKVREEDLGNYTCKATNVWGTNSKSILLIAIPSAPTTSVTCYANQTEECFIFTETLSYSPILSYTFAFKNISQEGNWCNMTIPGTNSSSIYHTKAYNVSSILAEFGTAFKINAKNEFGYSAYSKMMHVRLSSGSGIEVEGFDKEYMVDSSTEAIYFEDYATFESNADRKMPLPTSAMVMLQITWIYLSAF